MGTVSLLLLVPETQGVPLEEMQVVWDRHWLWGRTAMGAADKGEQGASGGDEQQHQGKDPGDDDDYDNDCTILDLGRELAAPFRRSSSMERRRSSMSLLDWGRSSMSMTTMHPAHHGSSTTPKSS